MGRFGQYAPDQKFGAKLICYLMKLKAFPIKHKVNCLNLQIVSWTQQNTNQRLPIYMASFVYVLWFYTSTE